MTIGSPIDKHLLLWPRLWNALEPKKANALLSSSKIHWRNYYDYGDPVGFQLDTARLWLDQVDCQAFEFCGCPKCGHDIGFARYLFPGEAHNEYWNDAEVFEHFVKDVVRPEIPRPKPPDSRWHVKWLSPLIPYMLSFLILVAAVFILYKAVFIYTHPGFDPLQKYVRFKELGMVMSASREKLHQHLFGTVAGIAFLIAGATLLSRLSRLARGVYWKMAGVTAYVIGCLLYWRFVGPEVRADIGNPFAYFGPHGPTVGILGLAGIGGLLGYLVVGRGDSGAERHERWFRKGTRPLMICGAVIIAVVVIWQMAGIDIGRSVQSGVNASTSLSQKQIQLMREAHLELDEAPQVIAALGPNWEDTLQRVTHVLAVHPSAWPVMLASAAFLYLWWLSILIFDLSFIWQRYIRESIANQRLRDWNPYGFPPRQNGKTEKCRKAQNVIREENPLEGKF
jgi:hypothetical protein